jgi:PPOX class probable F420-dependent enzyme
MDLPAGARALLAEARVLILASVRPDGRPHAVPVWFVWHDDRLYFATDAASVKARNLTARPQVAAVIERGGEDGPSHAVVVEGVARRLAGDALPAAVVDGFRRKYGWEPRDLAAFAIEPHRLRAW